MAKKTATKTAKTTQPVKATKTRTPAVSREEFGKAVQLGARNGKTNEEVAKELGMSSVNVFTTRLSQLRKQLREAGLDDKALLPPLKNARGDKAASIKDFASFLQENANKLDN